MLKSSSVTALLTVLLVPATLVSCHQSATSVPPLNLYYNAEEQPTEKSAIAQVLQAQLADKGIRVSLDPVSNSIYNDRLAKGDFESLISLWYLDYNDPEGFLTDFYSKAGYRAAKYNNPEYDKLYLNGLFAPNETEKLFWYKQAVALLQKDLPWIPLYSNTELFIMKQGAVGFQSNAFQYYDYRRVNLSEINAATDIEVQTLDPALVYDLASKHLVSQSYEGLVVMDRDSKTIPGLASKWTFSSRNDKVTFELRRGVYFHPSAKLGIGPKREMTAEDVRASFERVMKSTSPYTYIFDYVVGGDDFKAGRTPHVKGFEVVSKYTFAIDLTRPFPTMISWLLAPAAYILPKEVPQSFDFSHGSVGTGSFILRSFDGSTALFDANPAYWLKDSDGSILPKANKLTIRVIKDVNTLQTAFKRGEMDILDIPLALYNEYLNNDGSLKPEWNNYAYREVRLDNLKFIAFNMQKQPWGSRQDLRQQVENAIDRDAIVRQLFKNKARVANSVIPSGVSNF